MTAYQVRRLLLFTALGALLVASPAPAQADPAPPLPPGVQPGCVDPATSLPCSSQLQDINAAIRQELQQIWGGVLWPATPPR